MPQKLDNLVQLLAETHIKSSITLLKYQVFELAVDEGLGIFQVVKNSSWSGKKDRHSLSQSGLLLLRIFSSHQTSSYDLSDPVGEFLGDFDTLNAELSRWTDDDGEGTILSRDFGFLVCEEVEDWHEVGKGFSTSRFGFNGNVAFIFE